MKFIFRDLFLKIRKEKCNVLTPFQTPINLVTDWKGSTRRIDTVSERFCDAKLRDLKKRFSLSISDEQKRSEVKLAILVEGEPKVLFSIVTTVRCRGGRYSIPWITPLYS